MRAHKEARESAENKGVEIRYYNIIYDLVDDIKATLSGMLPPTLREERLGEAQILQIFDVSKVGKIAGCRVTDGVVQRGAHVRLIRDSVVIHEGKLSQLKRLKDDAKEVGSVTSAVCPSRTSRTCVRVTRSSATGSKRSAARSKSDAA